MKKEFTLRIFCQISPATHFIYIYIRKTNPISMKNYLLLSFLLIGTCSIYGQNLKATEGLFIGKNHSNATNITAKVYEFNRELPTFFLDTLNHYLYIKSRKVSKSGKYLKYKGHIRIVDLKTGNEVWNKKLDFFKNRVHYTYQGVLIYNLKGTSLLDAATGETIWKKDFIPSYIDPQSRFILSCGNMPYAFASQRIAKLRCIDMRTGEAIWQDRKINKYAWDNTMAWNDSTVLIYSDSLYALNLYKGIKWNNKIRTTIQNQGELQATNTIGSTRTNFRKTTTSGVNFFRDITGLVSNPLTDGSKTYLADRTSIVCVEDSGKVWETNLPYRCTRSFIFMENDHVYLVNCGIGICENKPVNVGKPFIACFRKDNGTLISCHLLTEQNKRVEDIIKNNGRWYIATSDEAYCLNPDRDGIRTIPWEWKTYGKLKNFVRDSYLFDPATSLFKKTDAEKDETLLVYTDERGLFEVTKNLEIITKHNPGKLYELKASWKNFSFLNRGGNPVYIVDPNGKISAELNDGSDFIQIFQNKLYMINSINQLVITDLEQLENSYFLNTK